MQVSSLACVKGETNTLKLFLGLHQTPPTSTWLRNILDELQSMSCTDRGVAKLLDVAELAYNLDNKHSMEIVQENWSTTPRSAPLVLSKFARQYNKRYEQLHLSHQSISNLLPQNISDTLYTHINLSHNNMKSIPEELFQLQRLQYLDLSHNAIEKLPSMLRWNCPKLKELNLSTNQLADERRGIIKGATERRRSHIEPTDPHSVPQQRVLQLTSHNLYSCVFSLTTVDLSNNPKLTRLPDWVCVLPHLVRLNLKGTPKLQELPKALANFKDLSFISVDPQSFLSPPAKVCSQGSAAIIAYLRSQLRGLSAYRHMNIMLLGWGDEKNKIAKELTSQKRQPQSSLSSIERGSYDYKGETLDRNVVKVTYHTINFSSEAMEFTLYHCFLISRCVYLCIWNLSDGKEGLQRLVPVLRNIQSMLPGSRVLFVIVHSEEKPELMLNQILSWESEVLGVPEPLSLYDETYSSSYGYPCIGQRFLINLSVGSEIDQLKAVIHQQAGELKVPNSSEKLIEEYVPRSYNGLQSHVESKIKLQVTLVRYGEFIDSFRSVSHQSGDLSNDDKEFTLACQFLHDSGTVYHYHAPNTSPTADLFILNLQWLCNMLAKILYKAKNGSAPVLSMTVLQSLLCSIGLVTNYHNALIGIMIKYNKLVPLDIERSRFLFPSLLPSLPPPHSPYDRTKDKVVSRKIIFRYLPCCFFSHYISRVLSYVDQLGAQLAVMAHSTDPPRPTEEKTKRSSSFRNTSKYRLSRHSYIISEDSEPGGVNDSKAINISITTMNDQTHCGDVIRSRLDSVSKSLSGLEQFSSNEDSWTIMFMFSHALIWKDGFHLEFLDGTLCWVEFFKESVSIVCKGDENTKVKSLAFLLSCAQDICNEWYNNLHSIHYSPCSSCLKNNPQKTPFYFNLSQVSLATDQVLMCEECQVLSPLLKLAPDLLLTDFSGELRLKKENLVFDKSEKSLIEKQVRNLHYYYYYYYHHHHQYYYYHSHHYYYCYYYYYFY